jgi:hypothetical protein
MEGLSKNGGSRMKKFMLVVVTGLILFLGTAITSQAQQFTCTAAADASDAVRLKAVGDYWTVIIDASATNSVPVGIQVVRQPTSSTPTAVTASTVTLWLAAGKTAVFEQGAEAFYCRTPSGSGTVGVTVRPRP